MKESMKRWDAWKIWDMQRADEADVLKCGLYQKDNKVFSALKDLIISFRITGL
jgi:hypothetical protein